MSARSRATRPRDQGYFASDKIGCHIRQVVDLAIRPVKFDRDVAVLDKASVEKALAESRHEIDVRLQRSGMQKSRSPASLAVARAPRAAM